MKPKSPIEEFVKNNHFAYYAKMNFRHGEDCICKKWDKSAETLKVIEPIAKPKIKPVGLKEMSLSEIETMAEFSDEIIPELLPF